MEILGQITGVMPDLGLHGLQEPNWGRLFPLSLDVNDNRLISRKGDYYAVQKAGKDRP